MASDADGNFAVVWSAPGPSTYRAQLRRFNAAGVPLGDPVWLSNSAEAGGTDEREVTIAMDADGDFVVVWRQGWYPGTVGDSDSNAIVARRFNAQGDPLGTSFHVNQYTPDRQVEPSVAMDADGDFIVVWQSWSQPPGGDTYDIYARRYNAAGAALGDEFRVNQNAFYRQQEADVAMWADGRFVVTWVSYTETGLGAVMLRAYRADGTPLIDEEIASTSPALFRPAVAVAGNGNVIVTYITAFPQDSGIAANVFDKNLSPLSGQIHVNADSGGETPDVAARDDGEFVVVWDAQGDDLHAREFDATGVPRGGQYRVNSATAGSNAYPAVAMNPDGDYVVTWTRYEPDSGPRTIIGQRFAHLPTVRASSFGFDAAPQRLVFTFSENVGGSLSASDVELVNLTTGEQIDPAKVALSWDAATFTASFSFPGLPGGVLPDGRYRARLPAASIADPGENTMTSDASMSFFFLAGDANHDARVDRDDLSLLTANWQQSPRSFSQGDFNYDTRVDARDVLILASNWRDSLPLIPEWRKPWSISQRSHFGPGEGLGDVVDLVASEA
ncbi:hypothetical protein [Fontivita pretiosa]|uniref:hypothetical protein n=1 Tax=Fontivita pretiosa TaxID=2989684 RepID=UPI003D169B91